MSMTDIPTKDDFLRIYPARLYLKEVILYAKIAVPPVPSKLCLYISIIHALLPTLINLGFDI